MLAAKAHLASLAGIVIALGLGLLPARGQAGAADQGPPASSASQMQETNSLELLRVCLQLQEELRATQVAIEQSRAETKAAAAQTAEALSNAFHVVEETFAAQRAHDRETIAASNRVTLTVAGTFAAVGFLTLLLVGYFQWRMSKGLAEITATLPAAMGLGGGAAAHALPMPAPTGLGMLVGAEPTRPLGQARGPMGHPAVLPRGGAGATNLRFFPSPAPPLPKPPVRALRTAVIVGLICAGILALLFYVVTCQQPGLGHFYQRFKLWH